MSEPCEVHGIARCTICLPSGVCMLCGEQMPCEEVLMHLHDEHQINVTLRCWPDGSPVIVDQSLSPEDFLP